MINEMCINDIILESAKEAFWSMVFMDIKEAAETDKKIEDEAVMGSITTSGALAICCSNSCARAIAKNPAVLLCDEPTGSLDSKTGSVVLAVLERINRELGTTTILITHNAVISAMADRVIKLADGCVVGIERPPERLAARELKW